jgi:serine/threonine-protein kinase
MIALRTALPAIAATLLLSACGGTAGNTGLPAPGYVPPLSAFEPHVADGDGIVDAAKPPKHIYIANYNVSTVLTFDIDGNQIKPTFSTNISQPHGIALSKGNLFVANSNAVTSYKAGSAKETPITLSGFNFAVGLGSDLKGDVFVTDYSAGTVSEYSPAGVKQPLSISGLADPQAVAVDKKGNIYVVEASGVAVFNSAGTPTETITAGMDSFVVGVAVDKNQKIYVGSCSGNNTGIVTTYLSSGVQTTPTIAGFDCPTGIAVDATGTIYVTDSVANTMTTYSAAGTQQPLSITSGLSAPWGIVLH